MGNNDTLSFHIQNRSTWMDVSDIAVSCLLVTKYVFKDGLSMFFHCCHYDIILAYNDGNDMMARKWHESVFN